MKGGEERNFQAGLIFERLLPFHSDNLTPHFHTSHTCTTATLAHLHLGNIYSQGALNSLALFDLGRSGVSVRYKPTVNHE